MKLQRLEMTNFRCFFGDEVVEFAEGDTKNVTLIHAQNNTGKTAILNALLWAFHGKFTKNFREPNLLVNHEAARQGKTTCKVAVEFVHEGREYEIIRTHDSRTKTNIPRVNEILEHGVRRAHPQQSALIAQVFPEPMAPYFFFDGEYAENFATTTSSKHVHTAIREMLGCTAAENALLDIKGLQRKLDQQIRALPNHEVAALQADLTKYKDVLETNANRVNEISKERDYERRAIGEIEKFLSEHAATKQHQAERKLRESELASAKNELDRERKARVTWLAKSAALVSGEKIAARCEELYREFEVKAQIPAPYNEEFVRALLTTGKCICDRCLEPGSPEATAVSQLLSTAIDKTVQRQLISVKAFCRRYADQKKDAIANLATIDRRINDAESKLHSLQQRMGELDTFIDGSASLDITERETARKTKLRRLEDLSREEGALNIASRQAQEKIDGLTEKIKVKALQDTQLRRLTDRREFLADAYKLLEATLQALEDEALATLRRDTNDLVERIFRVPVRVVVDDNFGLTLLTPTGEKAPPSGGQAQLLSLAFLASLIRFCANREKDKSILLQPGTVAPFVLDSPFGQLDPVYRRGAARFLPEYSNQLILLVSAAQGDQNSLQPLRDRVGSESIIVKENVAEKPSSQETMVEEIEVNGVSRVVTFWGASADRSHIENVAYYQD